jgi:DNA-directed RNA polymerase specialized sigma24 family protein
MTLTKEERKAYVLRRYNEGASLETISKEIGSTYRTVRASLFAAGGELRDPSARLRGRTRPRWTIK